MLSIEIDGLKIPAFGIVMVLLFLACAYVADAGYFGVTRLGYTHTIFETLEMIDEQGAGVKDKQRQAEELARRTYQISAIEAETKALLKSIALLKATSARPRK
jgi:hypothetical protein